MATRSTLAVKHKDGTVSQIYCHFDGYPSHHKPLLLDYYSKLVEAELLISFGDLSVLAERCEPLGTTHSFETPEDDTCIYYGRDRGETNIAPNVFKSQEEFYLSRNSEEYDYYFVLGQWCLMNHNDLMPMRLI
jgi:hypothetical protein